MVFALHIIARECQLEPVAPVRRFQSADRQCTRQRQCGRTVTMTAASEATDLHLNTDMAFQYHPTAAQALASRVSATQGESGSKLSVRVGVYG